MAFNDPLNPFNIQPTTTTKPTSLTNTNGLAPNYNTSTSGTTTPATVATPATTTPKSTTAVAPAPTPAPVVSNPAPVAPQGQYVWDANTKTLNWVAKTPIVEAPKPTLSTTQLGSSPSPAVPEKPDTTSDVNSAAAANAANADSFNNYASRFFPDLMPATGEKTDAQKKLERMDEINKQLLGKSTYQTEQNTTAGVYAQEQKLRDKQAEIKAKTAEYDALIQDQEKNGVPRSIVLGRQERLYRTKQIELSRLDADLQAIQGNLEAAQKSADRAVDMKYKPLETENEQILKTLELNDKYLNTSEKKQAEVLKSYLTYRNSQIQNEKDNKKLIESYTLEAVKNGMPDDAVQVMRSFTDPFDALKYANDWIAKKSKGLASMSEAEVNNGMRIGTKFDSLKPVINYQTLLSAKTFVKNIENNPTSADDQGLIYAFAKAMDPESVVREGEYATVQKYSQSWAEKFGFQVERMYSNTPFLTPQARDNMRKTINSKYDAARSIYNSTYKEKYDQMKMMGIDNPDIFLTDYSLSDGGVPGMNTTSPTAVTDIGQIINSAWSYGYKDPKAILDGLAKRPEFASQIKEARAKFDDQTIINWFLPENPNKPVSSGANSSGSVSFRNNNPLNIKFGSFAKGYGAVASTSATDGGQFAKFPDVATGLKAAKDLLKSGSYSGLPLEQAMRRWSGNGYGADVAPANLRGKTIGQMNDAELNQLIQAMQKREGWTPSNLA